MRLKSILTTTGSLATAALILSIPAFYNGYPLVYSDTGAYIFSGQELNVPGDRPIFFGLFIRLFSFGHSLWPVIWVQSAVLAYTMYVFLRLFHPAKKARKVLLIISSILAAVSGVAWYASQIMPDIFTPVCFLAFATLLFNQKLPRHHQTGMATVFLLAILMHFSNVAICILLVVTLLLLRLVAKNTLTAIVRFPQKVLLVGTLVTGSIILTLTVNYSIEQKVTLSKGGHAFIMGRLIDNGLLKKYLDESCNSQKYTLCQYRDSLPATSRKYLWNPESPLHQEGGREATGSENWQIIFDMVTTPRFSGMLTFDALTATASQVAQIGVASGLEGDYYASPNSPPYRAVLRFFPHEHNAYLNSRQNTNLWKQKLNFSFINKINYLILTGSALAALIFFLFPSFRHRFLNPELTLILAFVIGAIVVNAFVVANLSAIYDRLQGRVEWLLTFVLLVSFCRKELWLRWFSSN